MQTLKKTAGVAFPSAPNNCFPCGLRCRDTERSDCKSFVYIQPGRWFSFSPHVLLPVGYFLNSVMCHAACITRKYPCRKWKSTYQAESNTCFCISFVWVRGADSFCHSDHSLAGGQGKKLRKKHEENLLLPEIKRSRTWFTPVAVPGNNPHFIRSVTTAACSFFLFPLHGSFSVCQRLCGIRKVVWLAQRQRGADLLAYFSCILLCRNFCPQSCSYMGFLLHLQKGFVWAIPEGVFAICCFFDTALQLLCLQRAVLPGWL